MATSLQKIVLTLLFIGSLSVYATSNSDCQNNKPKISSTKPSIKHSPPTFNQLDIDNDGVVTLDEFSQHKLPYGKHDNVFARIDSDNNGEISEQELAEHKPPKHCHHK